MKSLSLQSQIRVQDNTWGFLPHLIQLSGSFTQSTLQRNLSHTSHPTARNGITKDWLVVGFSYLEECELNHCRGRSYSQQAGTEGTATKLDTLPDPVVTAELAWLDQTRETKQATPPLWAELRVAKKRNKTWRLRRTAVKDRAWAKHRPDNTKEYW